MRSALRRWFRWLTRPRLEVCEECGEPLDDANRQNFPVDGICVDCQVRERPRAGRRV